MKFILLLTLLLGTAFSAVDIPTTIPADVAAMISTFVSTLPVNSTAQSQITSNIVPCFATYASTMDLLAQYQKTLPKTMTEEEVFKSLQTYMLKVLNEQILPVCSKVYGPILQYLQDNKAVKIDNFNYYIVTFFQPEVPLAVLNLYQEMMSAALTNTNQQTLMLTFFQKAVDILKIIANNPKAKFPVVAIPFKPDIFVREFVTSFLLEFGVNPTVIQSINFCLLDLINAIDTTYLTPSQNLQSALQRCQKTVIPPSSLNSLLGGANSMTPNALFNLLTLQLTRNPSIIQYYSDLGTHISGAQYRLAGKDLAHLVQSLLMTILLNQ